MSILKIQPDAISNTESFVFGNVTATSITANGTNLGLAVAQAFTLANTANKSTTSDTAPVNPNVGDTWFDTVTGVILRYTYDGVSNNWIDISGPTNSGYIYQTYAITPNTSTINETTTSTVTYTVTTTNTADNTVFYWTNSGTTVAADFSDSANNGTVTITNNSGTITRTLSADFNTEGSETIILSLRTDSNTGPIIAVATTVTVNDTSETPLYKLYGTGTMRQGQLGLNLSDANYPNSYRSSPTQLGAFTDWYSTKSGQVHTIAIRANSGSPNSGTLWGWGGNDFGQNGTGDRRSSPVQIGSATNWSKIDSGGLSSAAIKTDGTLWLWGRNNYGQLGLNNTSQYSSPKQVGTNTNWSTVTLSQNAAAIKTDGTLWLWGQNNYGQLGLNDQVRRSSPTQVGTGTNWSKVNITNAFEQFTAAIKTDGTLWTWGRNADGQLGLGDNLARSSPVQVGTGTNWSVVATGSDHCIAIKTDGTLWGWGSNNNGQLGTAGGSSINSPTQIGALTNWSKIDAGPQISAAIRNDNTLWVFGRSVYGSAGLNTGGFGNYTSPTQVGSNTNWGEVTLGEYFSFFTTIS